MTLRQEIEKLRDDFEKGDTLSQLIAVTLTSILSRHTEEATVQDWAFILSNAIKHLKEEEIAGLCFDLYCRSSLQEVIDVKINTHKAQQPNGTIADAQAVHEYGTQSTAPSQRERIATAVFVSILSEKDKAIHIPTAASSSVYSADALIAELNKKTK